MSKRLLPAKEVRAMFGDISAMTLWRWLKDDKLGFPKPAVVIRNRNFFDADEIEVFRDHMVGVAISRRAA